MPGDTQITDRLSLLAQNPERPFPELLGYVLMGAS